MKRWNSDRWALLSKDDMLDAIAAVDGMPSRAALEQAVEQEQMLRQEERDRRLAVPIVVGDVTLEVDRLYDIQVKPDYGVSKRSMRGMLYVGTRIREGWGSGESYVVTSWMHVGAKPDPAWSYPKGYQFTSKSILSVTVIEPTPKQQEAIDKMQARLDRIAT